MKSSDNDGNGGFTPISEVTELVGPAECVNPDIPGILSGFFDTSLEGEILVGKHFRMTRQGRIVAEGRVKLIETMSHGIRRLHF